MHSVNTYYQTLGISNQASLSDIKNAYRQKAKILHPDKNKSETAHEDFLLLNESYEYLIKLKEGKVSPQKNSNYQTNWADIEREKAKARAREYAQMKYNEFINSNHYKSLSSLDTVFNYVITIGGLGIFIFVGYILITHYGIMGILLLGAIVLITSPITYHIIKNSPSIELNKFFSSVTYLLKTNAFFILSISIINIYTILKIGLQTLLPTELLFSSIGLIILLAFGISKWIIKMKNNYTQNIFSFCYTPLLISILLILNFVFSSNPSIEIYEFEKEMQTTRRGVQESTFIHLIDNTYDEYPGIRMFYDYEPMQHKNTISYTFENGLFGIRVLKNWKFTYVDNVE